MNYQKKISVIVPIYNSSRTIVKCIDSILKQTYTNLEIILVNDGSTDNSLDICLDYEKLDKRIVIINKKNGGVSSARNAGIKAATGEYLAFVDSDDYIDNNMFEKLLKNIFDNNSDISICNLYIENEKGDEVYSLNYENKTFRENEYPFISYFNKSISGYACNKLYSRNLIFKENMIINFNENIAIAEDDLFNYIILKNNNEICYSYIDEKLYHYVSIVGSATNSSFNYSQLSYFDAKKEEIEILDYKKINSDFLKIDFFINFVKTSYKMKILNINYNNKFDEIKLISNSYLKVINLKNIPIKFRFKFFIAKYFPIFYKFKIKKDINKI